MESVWNTFVLILGLSNRFEEYPKLRELILLKDEQIQKTNTPPMCVSFLCLVIQILSLICVLSSATLLQTCRWYVIRLLSPNISLISLN